MEKRSTSLLNRMIRAMKGAPMTGAEDIIPITRPSQCPYPLSREVSPNTPTSTPSWTFQRLNLASRVLVLLELAGRSTTMSIAGMLAEIVLKKIVLRGCQMRSHPLPMHGSVTSANHERLQVGLVDKGCLTMKKTTRRKVCCPQVSTV